jgi:ADP-ribose pyrophosphatase YjhB (NUDIX family)
LLVQTFIFADDHLLLMQRGLAPYRGQWSPPGGFVDAYESAEQAAIREVREEVGLELAIEQLLPMATVSVESINQVYLMFLVKLGVMQRLQPMLPEAMDARWVRRGDFPLADIWEPFTGFDMAPLFDRVKAGRFEYYQRTDDFIRTISACDDVHYLRREKRNI